MLSNLSNEKAIGLRGISHEMLKYCSSPKLASTIAKIFDCMVNEQIQLTTFNVSILKPIIKDTNKLSEEI